MKFYYCFLLLFLFTPNLVKAQTKVIEEELTGNDALLRRGVYADIYSLPVIKRVVLK